ncbi:hypothetical protein EJ04DRAFT_537587 [Polyplosphaeria fusca]|uniref:Uncharacterized protein n=1 Tax=Polyplosphaeria fusca TaxID=682080 RepID=A0A9P4QM60_9PLEO|nr:hypothetical protein EJ04DRAFT_537587 [Polyplosphaeria fusca]
MSLLRFCTSLFFLTTALLSRAAVTQKDFSGVGHIYVLNSSDWRTGSPKQKVGCLDNNGRFLAEKSLDDCGTFVRLDDYPWTLSSKEGNCTFNDETTATNTDSYYGKNDHAWTCNASYSAIIYDELFTVDGFPYPFLCSGDLNCYYDAKAVPGAGDVTPMWAFRWGSQQRGITPGHVMLQLMWSKLGDNKRENIDIPSPRVVLKDGMQVPLQGPQVKS